jgi:F-type H+-transporting ATPase subunit a
VGGAALFCWAIPYKILPAIGVPPAVRPVIQLPGEALTAPITLPVLGEVAVTNTLLHTWISYLIIIIVALLARRGLSEEAPKGIANAVEVLVEFLLNIAEQAMGRINAKRIFPWAATIFILIMVANLSKLVPGFESIGILHHAHEGSEGADAQQWFGNVYMLIPGESAEESLADGEHVGTASEEGEGEDSHELCQHNCVVTPFLRGAATDINFPLGLAVVSFIVIQVFGVMGLGGAYLGKFVNIGALEMKDGPLGLMDFLVGLLDLVLEPIKMVSLTFRLLGNIFGGAVLVIVVSMLVPFVLPTALYGYELFVGIIQAYVFFMLTIVFSAMAMISHGGEEHH